MAKYFIGAGHTTTGTGTGAVGYINESNENRVIAKKVVEYLKLGGHSATYGEINSSSNYLAEQVKQANANKYDLVVQIHFNAYRTTSSTMGCEVLYYDNSSKAKAVADKLGTVFKNRGAKCNKELYWLRNTTDSAILVETCFVDSKADTDLYKSNVDKVAKLIAEGICGHSINTSKETTYYRVVVGSYTSRDNANNALEDAKKKGYTNAFLDVFVK